VTLHASKREMISQNINPLWDSKKDYIRVVLKDLVVETQVGIHKWEHHPERPTRLILNIEMFAHTNNKKYQHDRNSILDYDHIRDEVKTWPERQHTPLLETLAEELIELCFKNEKVEACRVSLLKPDIFNEAAGAGIEVYRIRPKNP